MSDPIGPDTLGRLSWPITNPSRCLPTPSEREGWTDQEAVIRHAVDTTPRSLQVALGPSEVGSPCARKVAFALAQVPERMQPVAWLPTIGTAVHAWLTETFLSDNATRVGRGEPSRWVVDQLVQTHTPAGRRIAGHFDLYDLLLGEVVDWKVVGKTTLDKARRSGDAGTGYTVQLGVYVRGARALGMPVHRGRVVFLPRNGPLMDAVSVTVDVDRLERAAAWGLSRYDDLYESLEALGRDAIPLTPTADDHCGHCAWYSPAAAGGLAGAAEEHDPTQRCLGHDDKARRSDGLTGLIARTAKTTRPGSGTGDGSPASAA